MRVLHAGRADGGQGPARPQSGTDRDRGALLAGGQPVSLHRLRQDHPRGHGDRRRIAPGKDRGMNAPTGKLAQDKGYRVVGTRPVRPDGVDKVTGKAIYSADFAAPGMLCGAILRSPHAHARIRAIDTSAAQALPGVKAMVTGADLPDDAELMARDPLGTILDTARHCLALDKALFDGHAVAAVAATNQAVADA